MAAENRCRCCRGLYSLAAECLVVTFTLVHVLLSTVELMIHLDVIHVPRSGSDDNSLDRSIEANETTSSPPTPSQAYDPGGCDVSLHPHLNDTVEIVRYSTLVISALFFIEIVCKMLYLKKTFLKDPWQIIDTLIVLLSLGVEIAFFLVHEKMLCYSPATEAATFVIILRLWRIPRTCNVRKMEYKRRLEDQHHFLRLTKTETENKCKELEKKVQNQSAEIRKYKTVLMDNNLFVTNESQKFANGNGPFRKGIDEVMHHETRRSNEHLSGRTVKANNQSDEHKASEKSASDLDRNDSDKNSRANDSGIEVKDSFRSEKDVKPVYTNKVQMNDDEVFDSDGSEFPVPAKIQEVEVQIEEISRQRQLPSVTSYRRSIGDEEDDVVLLRRKSSTTAAAAFVNEGYDQDEIDGRGTYRSADGIPMTEL